VSDPVELVLSCIEQYDRALRAHDLDVVDAWFVDSPGSSRFGVGGVAYGHEAIASDRRNPAMAAPAPIDRVDGRHELTALGADVVVATLEHRQPGDVSRRRRTQVWWQIEPGRWRIAHAHLSIES